MALKDSWEDLEDKVQGDADSGSEISVKPINEIAHAVIDIEANKADKSEIPSLEGLASETYVNEKLSQKANTSDLASVAISGSYNDLNDTPEIPSVEGLASVEYVDNAINSAIGEALEGDY